jgi:hypothetical protein
MGFDLDTAGVAGCPVVEAAPRPVFGFFHQTTFDRIAVDVFQLLDPLWMSEHVEVVVAGLPELGARAFEYFGDLALENTESGGERMELWFAEEKVDVFGHEDVAEEEEPVSPSESFESLFKNGAGAVVVEIWEAVGNS